MQEGHGVAEKLFPVHGCCNADFAECQKCEWIPNAIGELEFAA